MFNLNTTDVLEAIASVNAVIKFTISGHDATAGVISNQGTVADANTALYTAVGATRIYSVTFYNSHNAAVTITLNKDPANAGTLYPFFSISLGIGYSLHFDGTNFSVFDASGNLQTGAGGSVSDTAYDVTAWDGVTAIAPSKNAVRDALLQTLLTAQGDIVYASAANVIARLAKGAANTKLFVNAGATAPEWASGMKLGTFTIDTATASGDQVITGVGFKPSNIIFLAGVNATTQFSIGFSNGTLNYCILNYHGVAATQWAITTLYCLFFKQAVDVDYLGTVAALGADGFTITWVKNGAKTGTATILYIAFR